MRDVTRIKGGKERRIVDQRDTLFQGRIFVHEDRSRLYDGDPNTVPAALHLIPSPSVFPLWTEPALSVKHTKKGLP